MPTPVQPLRVLMVTAELAPFAKAGGLADMVAGLAAALAKRGHDVRILLPRYRLAGMPPATTVADAASFVSPVRLGAGHPAVMLAAGHHAGRPLYFVDAPGLIVDGEIYGGGAVEACRYALLAHAVGPLLSATGFAPDVIHCHDWHTALVPLLLGNPVHPGAPRPRTVLTLHNVGYQGRVDAARIDELGLSAHRAHLPPQDLAAGRLSFLRAGIQAADALTTVSPTHAREIVTAAYGHGLEDLLAARSADLTGILNGVDYGEWDPATDRHLPAHFSPERSGGRGACRAAAAQAFGLDPGPGPLLGCVARLATQKGLDLLLAVLPDYLAAGRLRAVVLGTGDPALATAFGDLMARFPGRFAFAGRHDEPLARLVYAGSDAFAVPSRYEPCGLTQMYALRYGAVPVVRATGGLADTVTHFDPATGLGTGAVFRDADAGGLRWGLDRMLEWYAEPVLWTRLMANGMAADFAWDRQVPAYEAVYRGSR